MYPPALQQTTDRTIYINECIVAIFCSWGCQLNTKEKHTYYCVFLFCWCFIIERKQLKVVIYRFNWLLSSSALFLKVPTGTVPTASKPPLASTTGVATIPVSATPVLATGGAATHHEPILLADESQNTELSISRLLEKCYSRSHTPDDRAASMMKLFMMMTKNTHGMVSDLHEKQVNPNKWREMLPEIDLKSQYLTHPPIVRKGGRMLNAKREPVICQRAQWPNTLGSDGKPLYPQVDMPKWKLYMKGDEPNNIKAQIRLAGSTADAHLLQIGRLLGAIELPAGHDPESPEVLVALYCSGILGQLMNHTNIYADEHSWTEGLLNSLAAYTAYQLLNLGRQVRDGKDKGAGPEKEMMTLIETLQREMDTVWRSRINDWREWKCAVRARQDRETLANYPGTDMLQEAVVLNWALLIRIFEKYGPESGQTKMPSQMWTIATSCLSLIISYETFHGRQGNWANLEYESVIAELLAGKAYLECKDYKTRKVYGDLALSIHSDLLRQALDMYSKLPRENLEYPYFFYNPHSAQHDRNNRKSADPKKKYKPCCLPRNLHLAQLYSLLASVSHPTFTDSRKWYHTFLIEMTASQQGVYDIMTIIDAHNERSRKATTS